MIIYKNSVILLIAIILCFQNPVKSQSPELENLQCFWDKNEKVFVHLEKQALISGEALNYSAYILNAVNHKPSPKSKILYFELVNAKNSMVFSWKANVINGHSGGSVIIPDSIADGFYTLYAFTNWMRNMPREYFYSSHLVITQLTSNPTKLPMAKNCFPLEDSVIIMPESGRLLEGVKTKMAVFVCHGYQTNKKHIAYLKDSTNQVLDTVTINKPGLTWFWHTPRQNQEYFLELNNKGGKRQQIALPKAKLQGCAISIRSVGNTLEATVVCKGQDKNMNATLHAMAKGAIVQKTLIKNGTTSQVVTVPKNKLPGGIVNFVLTNEMGYKLCSRSYYFEKRHKTKFNLNLPQTCKKRQDVKLKLDIGDLASSDTVLFSVSISRKNPFSSFFQNQTIDNYVQLYSEIAKNNSLNYGVLNAEELNCWLITMQNADLFWKTASKNPGPNCKYLMENKGYVLSGQLLNKKSNKPSPNTLVLCSSADSITQLKYFKTNNNGNFHFLLENKYDNKNIILQTGEKAAKSNKEFIWNTDMKEVPKNTAKEKIYQLSEEEKGYIKNLKNIHLTQIIYPGQAKVPTDTCQLPYCEIGSQSFYGKPDWIEYMAEYVELEDFKEIMDNLFYGIRFKESEKEKYIQIFDTKYRFMMPPISYVFLNGVPFNDLEYLSTLGSKEIKKIEVCNTRIIYGEMNFHGTISVQTYDGKIPEKYLQSKTLTFYNKVLNYSSNESGFSLNQKKDQSIHKPDFRESLFWAPRIVLSGKKDVEIEFTSSDLAGNYLVNIQGITSKGQTIDYTGEIKVSQ